jgi:RNA polymerase sigma factor (sigma-70 family)
MEASALKYHHGIGLPARSPLLRLQSDERLITLLRRGNTTAFEVLVSRYEARLLAFCRHLLGSREDAEDVLQEVMTAAFNAIVADDRPINVRPWLYRIARNRSLNHLRRTQAIGVDSMDHHLAEHGTSTADKVHQREEFRVLVGDIQGLPETQRTALVLREMDALSYEQIAEAMETTVSSVKSLLVRARVSLAEAAQARMLTCEEVREELGEVAEGLRRRPGALVRRHLRTCDRCSTFKSQLNDTSKALAAVLPIGLGPLMLFRKLAILHIGHSAGAGSSASGASAAGQAAAVGSTAAAGASAVVGSGSTGFISASVGAIATKAAAGLAAAALVTAGAVEVDHSAGRPHGQIDHHAAASIASLPSPTTVASTPSPVRPVHVAARRRPAATHVHKAAATTTAATTPHKTLVKPVTKHATTTDTKSKDGKTKTALPGRTQTQTVATVLPAQTTTATVTTTPATSTCTDTSDTATTPTTSATTTTTTTPGASSDPGSTTATTTPTTSTTPGAASDPTSTSTQATTPTPPPAAAGDYTCSADSSGSSTQPAPSGGTAP